RSGGHRAHHPYPPPVERRDGERGTDDQLQTEALEPSRRARPTREGDPPVRLGDQSARQQGEQYPQDATLDHTDGPGGGPEGPGPLEFAATPGERTHGDVPRVPPTESVEQRARPLPPPCGGGEGEHVPGL